MFDYLIINNKLYTYIKCTKIGDPKFTNKQRLDMNIAYADYFIFNKVIYDIIDIDNTKKTFKYVYLFNIKYGGNKKTIMSYKSNVKQDKEVLSKKFPWLTFDGIDTITNFGSSSR